MVGRMSAVPNGAEAESGEKVPADASLQARRSTLRDSLLRKGSRSVFWTEHKLPSPPPPKAQPPPFFTENPTHQHPGTSKALAVFWDCDRFDIAGDHEHCMDAVNAIRSFCNQFVGLSSGARQHARGTVRITGYAEGGSDPDAAREKLQADAVVPDNAGRRAGVRLCCDNAGLKDQALASLIPDLNVVARDPFGEKGGSSDGAVSRHCPQMLTDILVWMLDCTKRRLFVPTAIVISDDPYIISALSMLATRGAYTILLTKSSSQDRKRGDMQVVLPFDQVVAAHMPLGTPPARVVDRTDKPKIASADKRIYQRPHQESPRQHTREDGVRRTHSHRSSKADTSAEPSPQRTPRQRPATSPSKSPGRSHHPRRRPATSPSKAIDHRPELVQAPGEARGSPRLRLPASRPASARPRALSDSGSAREHEKIVGTRVATSNALTAANGDGTNPSSSACHEPAGCWSEHLPEASREAETQEAPDCREAPTDSPRSSRTWGGVGGSSRGSSPSSPRVPLVGDELGSAAKMWCCWSRASILGVGEAVSIKRSDGRYTLGVVVGLGTASHYSTIHERELAAGEVEILCDFEKKTGQRVTRINRIETVGKFPSPASLAASGRLSSLSNAGSGARLERWSALEDKMLAGANEAENGCSTRPSWARTGELNGALRAHVVRPHTALPARQRNVSFSAGPEAALGSDQNTDAVALSPRKVMPVGGGQARPLSAL